MGFVIDTCIWIDVERGALHPSDIARVTKNSPVYISPITIAELTFGAEHAKSPAIRHQRLAALQPLLRKPMLRIDEITATIYGALAATLASARGHQFRIHDLWLASSALQHHCQMLTWNLKDFTDIPGLRVVAPKAQRVSPTK